MKWFPLIGGVVIIGIGALVWHVEGMAFQPPTLAPSAVQIQPLGSNQLQITWGATPGATRYWVSIAPGRVTMNAANQADTFILDQPVSGTTYTWPYARSSTAYTVWISSQANVLGSGWLTGPHSAGETVITPAN